MLNRFNQFIKNKELITNQESIILAVSGGIDSMVMLHLFEKQLSFKFVVAHCNFNLRGEESNLDELLVQNYCKDNNIQFHSKSFDTTKYANKHGISIQMAARDLRYDWFEQLAQEYKHSKIALAQHLDDQAETFFINLVRGTGIAGIHGILPINGKLIRPLLFTIRQEIEVYQQEYSVPYREDQSNKSDKYVRNNIRHNILPKFEEIAPKFSQKLDSNINNFREVELFYKKTIQNNLHKIIHHEESQISINIDDLIALEFIELHLRELLIEYNFNNDTIYKVYLQVKNPISGKQFESDTHNLLINRSQIIIQKKKNSDFNVYHINEGENIIFPINIVSNTIKGDKTPLKTKANIALLDRDKLAFPLTLRKWRKSDYFHPLGMSGRKKLSDFFIDNKISLFQKSEVWVLLNGNEIVWIVGHRIDNNYRISNNTQNIFKLTLQDGTN